MPMPVDLVQRFCPTPLAAVLPLNGAVLRVATNDQLVLDRLRAVSAPARNSRQASIMHWRIVVEEGAHGSGDEFVRHAFQHDGLGFIRLSNASFLAANRQARCGISFIAANLIKEEGYFIRYFLPALISIIDDMGKEI